MQAVKTKLLSVVRRFAGRPAEVASARAVREFRWGVAGALLMGVVLLASALVYVIPFGKSTYWAEMPELGSIKVGDNVRIAGVPVGSVKSVELGRRNVRMSFTIDHGIFIGDQTSLEIRMLTLIGGHYLAVTPTGKSSLRSTIPSDRVRLPYSLGRVFQDAVHPIADIDGDALRKNLTSMNRAIASGPSGIRRAVDAFASLVDVLDRQNRDVSDTLAMADEYIGAINNSKAILGELIASVNLMETVGLDKQAEIFEAVRLMDQLLSRIAALEPVYRSRLESVARSLADVKPELIRLGEGMGQIVTSTRDLLSRLQPIASSEEGVVVDQSASVVLAQSVCIPVPGKGC
ncbi:MULTISPECIES: MlaD family protein [Nocardia]|uniref:Virulence factor Mce family protein n=1 Tax=Nocardia africana TaxID=134964 RepID=A0A378X788_9NOCA|nr:MlaD family protein [Nocardia africana]MCC3317824.1 MlaD family protein [Nocardia africana]SUA48594.1 virulence factor Mce family protein [Nocardia africana]